MLPVAGCHQSVYDPTVWRMEVRSLMAHGLQQRERIKWGGFETARVGTTVSIRKLDGTFNHESRSMSSATPAVGAFYKPIR